MKSIGKRIFYTFFILTLAALLVLGFFASWLNYSSTMNTVESDFQEMAKIGADRASWEITAYSNIAAGLGSIAELADPAVSNVQKQSILVTKADYYGFQRCNLIDLEGNGLDGSNYADREYFQKALQGQQYVSSPLISKITGKVTIIIAAPLWADGKVGGTVAGCVYVVPDEEFLNDIVRDIKLSENGSSYIINASGDTIAHMDSNVILEGENVEALMLEDPDDPNYDDLAAVHKLMEQGESGFSQYYKDGERRFIGYAPVENTDGWALAVWSPANDFMKETYQGFVFTIVVVVVATIIVAIVSVRLGTQIGRSVRFCTERIEKLAKGDLRSPVPEIHSKDESGRLAEGTRVVVTGVNDIIGDIGRVLEAMADGDLSVDTRRGEMYYMGDYGALLDYMRDISTKLNDTMVRIDESADQVSNGSEQVSAGAQALSQGATEQASEIEALAARIHTISEEVTENSENCASAKTLVSETMEYVNTAADEMGRLTEAMTTISETSASIENIIKTIDDIAFQTNILALNAAVEAARAGEAGKGFAVVADEVRNLASKSGDAAQSTTALIEKSIEAVKNGTRIASETAEAMTGVEHRAGDVEAIVAKIADASDEQAGMIEQITMGIEQISSVVQTNSATAEQSAAASEELSGQANLLRELISKFKLK